MMDYEPSSGFNLPPGLHEDHRYFNDEGRTCATCRHCIEECCDMGLCEVRFKKEPVDFDDWAAVLDFMGDARVDMQVDTCARWEEEL